VLTKYDFHHPKIDPRSKVSPFEGKKIKKCPKKPFGPYNIVELDDFDFTLS
jgi:hypothetical protein